MYEFRQILKTDLKNLYTNPMWWIGAMGLPLLLALIMGFITQGAYGTNTPSGTGVTSYNYYAITMLIFGALNNSTIAANSFMEGRIMKANMRLCNAPIPNSFIFLPKIIASLLFGTLCHTLAASAIFFITGVNFGGGNAIFLWLLLLAVYFFAVCFSVMLCCILKKEETVNMILSTAVSLLCLLGGAFFPMKGLGRIVEVISNISPVTWISTAAFQAVYDNRLILLGLVCAGMLALAGLCIALTTKLFNREDYL
ncbi:MAG: ABC transporter permease [Peptococcaceae bacterium]|nr:ABC transporter permease [Peptococcaceae bacterium]